MGQSESTPSFGFNNASLLSPESGRSAHQFSILGELGGNVTYEKSIGASRSVKVVKARYHPLSRRTDGDAPTATLVVKVFPKASNTLSLKRYTRRLKQERDLLQNIPNVLVYQRILETEKAAYALRQWASTSLYDRISTRPFLSLFEKKWIAFQLLTALQQAHELKVPHGDIKSENILITSSLWAHLSDFASFKPTFLPLNDPADFSYWFDSSGRRTCYIAPERFYAPDSQTAEPDGQVTPEMDIFSLGCVLAEMFADGAAPFSLSQMFRYRNGEFSTEMEIYLSQIEDAPVAAMIRTMLSLDSTLRKTCDFHLSNSAVFPQMLADLHLYMCRLSEVASNSAANSLQSRLQSSSQSSRKPVIPMDIGLPVIETVAKAAPIVLSDSDSRIQTMAQDWQHLSSFVQDSTKLHSSASAYNQNTPVFPMRVNIGKFYGIVPESTRDSVLDDPASILLLNAVAPCLRNASSPSNVGAGLNMLLYLSLSLSDETNLDRLLPYIVVQLRNESATVRALAVYIMTLIIIRTRVITMSNAALSTDYVLPNLAPLVVDSEPVVRVACAICLGPLAESSLRSLSMVNILRSDQQRTSTEISENPSEESYDSRLTELQSLFEEMITPLLLTDTSSIVRRSLAQSIVPLCLFFGRLRASDILLSRTITFLNDKNWALRSAFFECAVDFATCIGGRTLDDYILPLVDQALHDSEENVQSRVLAALKTLLELRFLKQEHVLNLTDALCGLVCHPNAWIRRYAIDCFCLAAKQLQETDLWCTLYPRLRLVLRADIQRIDAKSTQRNLTLPLSRIIYEAASEWCARRSTDTVFWQNAASATLKRPTNAKLSDDDQKQMERLRTLGMRKDDEVALYALRRHLFRNAQSKQTSLMREGADALIPQAPMGNVALQDIGTPTETIFLNPQRTTPFPVIPAQISSPLAESYTESPTLPSMMSPDDAKPGIPQTRRIGSQGVAIARVSPAVAEVRLSAAGTVHSRSASIDSGITNNVILSPQTTYDGNNIYIRQLVDRTFPNTLPSPPSIKHGPLQRRGIRGSVPHRDRVLGDKSDGLLIAHLAEHNAPISHLVAAPDNLYFLSASQDGTVKVWDSLRLERNVTGRSRHTFTFPGRISALFHLPDSRAFVVATGDGTVYVQSILVVTTGTLPKYGKQSQPRSFKYERPGEYVTSVGYTSEGDEEMLICATSAAEICHVGLANLEIQRRIKVSRKYGAFTCMAIEGKQLWAAVGTSLGWLLLFDLRFGLLLKSIVVSNQPSTRIFDCQIRPHKGKGRHIVCTFPPDPIRKNTIEVWDIARGQLVEAFSVGPEATVDLEAPFRHPTAFGNAKEKNNGKRDAIEAFLEDSQKEERSDSQSPTTHAFYIASQKKESLPADWSRHQESLGGISSGELVAFPGDNLTYMVTGGDDVRLRFWDLANIERSAVLSSPDESETSSYSTAHVDVDDFNCTLHTEVTKKPENNRHRSTVIAQYQQSLLRAHQSTITAITMLYLPYKAVVSGDADGIIKIFTM